MNPSNNAAEWEGGHVLQSKRTAKYKKQTEKFRLVMPVTIAIIWYNIRSSIVLKLKYLDNFRFNLCEAAILRIQRKERQVTKEKRRMDTRNRRLGLIFPLKTW